MEDEKDGVADGQRDAVGRKRLMVDFDGVLHLHRMAFKAYDIIEDEPVPGAIAWLRELIEDERVDVAIFSARNVRPGGIAAMRAWLFENGLEIEEVDMLVFPEVKIPAHLYIDDRGYCFRGEFPRVDELVAFVPWSHGCGLKK